MQKIVAALSVVYALAVLVTSILPPDTVYDPKSYDFAIHAGAYLIMAILVYAGWKRRAGRSFIFALIGFVIVNAWGLMIEGLQSLTPHRAAEARDVMWNAIGALAGILLCLARPQRGKGTGTT